MTLVRRTAPFILSHNGTTAEISDDQTFCNACGTISYVGEQIGVHERAVAARIREIEGLLSAEELRNIRLKYGFRQTDMEAMLSIGPKTWTRWERGKIPQNKAADTLIRILGDDPDVAQRLMHRACIENAAADEVFSAIDRAVKQRAEARLVSELGIQAASVDLHEVASRAVAAVREARFSPVGVAA